MKARGGGAPPPPPSGSAPSASRESIEIVKKIRSQPAGPPPDGMSSFRAPKQYPSQPLPSRDNGNGNGGGSGSGPTGQQRWGRDSAEDDEDDEDNWRANNTTRRYSRGSSAYDEEGSPSQAQTMRRDGSGSTIGGGGGGGGSRSSYRDDRDYDRDRERDYDRGSASANGSYFRGIASSGRGSYRGSREEEDEDSYRAGNSRRDQGYNGSDSYGGTRPGSRRGSESNDESHWRSESKADSGRPDSLKCEVDDKDAIQDFDRRYSHSERDHEIVDEYRKRLDGNLSTMGGAAAAAAGTGGSDNSAQNKGSGRPSFVPDFPKEYVEGVFNFRPLLRATYRELKNFSMFMCDPGKLVRCYIERNRSGSNFFSPIYSLCADMEDGTGRELMLCRKVLTSRTTQYIFSLKADDLFRKKEQRSRLYLGKLKMVTSDTYVLYDNGICDPSFNGNIEEDLTQEEVEAARDARKEMIESGIDESSLYRKELAVIHFNSKIRPAPTGIRGCEVCLPIRTATRDSFSSKDSAAFHRANHFSLVDSFEKIRQTGKQNLLYAKKIYVMHERTSKFDPLSSCLVDFKGRANIASVKNCQFIESTPGCEANGTEGDFVLQLGKTTEDCFNMDFRHPLSLLQAFAICVARFDYKLTWS